MFGVNMKIGSKQQSLAIPMNLDSLIVSDHKVRIVRKLVDKLDLSCIEKQYKSTTGRPPYNVYDMFAMMVFAAMENIHSVRMIDKACKENICFMWLMGMETPNHASINNFQHRVASVQEDIMREQIKLLVSEGQLSKEFISIDGTKVQSKANKYTNVYLGSVGHWERQMEDAIYELLTEADSDIIPVNIKELLEIEDISKVKYTNSKSQNRKYEPRLEIEDIFTIVKWLITLDEQIVQDNKSIQLLVKKIDGYFLRKLKYIEQRKILAGRNSYSKTDIDASFMKLKDDSFDSKILSPAYNIQMATSDGYILNSTISNLASDTRQLEKMMDELEKVLAINDNTVILADPGYGSRENFEILEAREQDYVIPYMSHRHESKRKYKNNHCTIEKFEVLEDYAICPNGERLEFIYEQKTVSPSGFETVKRIFGKEGCANCPFVNECTNGKDKKTIYYDKKWIERKAKERENFESREEEYKMRYEVERCFGVMKHNHKLSRFRHVGLKQNLAIWNLQSIAANISLLIKRESELNEQKETKDKAVNTQIMDNIKEKVANKLMFTALFSYITSF
jgi:transposase